MPSIGFKVAAMLVFGASQALGGYALGVTQEKQRYRKLQEAEEEPPEWTYFSGEALNSALGPEDWGESFPDCYGSLQSPINLSNSHESVKPQALYDLVFHPTECSATELTFNPGEHTWMVDFSDCTDRPSLTFDGDHYLLLQAHIHSVSEHESGGTTHDAEIHMVHLLEGTTDRLLVVGVLMDVGVYGSNTKLDNMWSVLQAGTAQAPLTSDWTASPYELLPAGPDYSHYMGSLTTPPCTEGVKWIVMSDITMLGGDQLEAFRDAMALHHMTSAMGHTNRPVQALNGRAVHYVSG